MLKALLAKDITVPFSANMASDLHRRLPRCISLYRSMSLLHISLDVRSTSGTVFVVVVAMIITCLSALVN